MPARHDDPRLLEQALFDEDLARHLRRGELAPAELRALMRRGVARRMGGSGRRGVRGKKRPRGGGGPTYLLDYAAATFTRSSEAAAVDPRAGWAWYDLETPWPGVDVPRILPDGAILIEGARTNLVQHNRQPNQSPWTSYAGKVAADVDDGPDGLATADRIQTASATIGCDQGLSGTGDYTGSFYVRQGPGGAGTYQMLLWTGADLAAVGGSAPAEWARATVFNNVAAAPNVRLAEGNDRSGVGGIVAGARDSLVDLAQVEAAAFPSSPIRTSGAAATRALDDASYAGGTWDSRLNDGVWEIDVWPGWASSEAPASAFMYLFQAGSGGVLYFYKNAGNLELRMDRLTTGGAITPRVLMFSAHQQLTLKVDWPAQELTISGATSGDGTVALSHTDWNLTPSTDPLYVGLSASNTRALYGVLSRPRAA